MKTIQIMLLSLIITTQSFAWGQAEQKALLGFTAGIALTHFISTCDNLLIILKLMYKDLLNIAIIKAV